MNRFAPLALSLLLCLPMASVPSFTLAAGTVVSELPAIKYPRKKRVVFNPRADGKRDQLQHLLYLAESPDTARKRGRGYRHLAEILLRVGRNTEAMRAYEAGALQGDGPSATVIMRAHADGRFKPNYLAELLPLVYVPRARMGGTSGPMLMAELAASGRIKGFGTSGEWLQVAASRGSTQATVQLAEAAERQGKLQTAAKLYASIDKISRLDRALRQARVNYLGEDTKRNSALGLAWLERAIAIDAAAAGKQAASLYRKDVGPEEARARLMDVALAAGINPQGSGGFSTRLREATSAEARDAILAEIRQAADAGNAAAALTFAQDRLALGDSSVEPEAFAYLEQALSAGLEPAVSDAAGRLVSLPPDSPRAQSLLAAITRAADSGGAAAMWALADLYAWGGPVAADPDKSLHYVQLAADAGQVEAQLRLGLHFAQQKADPEQAKLALRYLEAAAGQGSAPAKAYLAAFEPAS